MRSDSGPAASIAYGVFLADRGEDAEAVVQFEAAWERAKALGASDAVSVCCHNLAELYRRAGNFDMAARMQQLSLAAEMTGPVGAGTGSLSSGQLSGLAADVQATGEFETSLRLLNAAQERAVAEEADSGAHGCLENSRGAVLARLGRTGPALQRFLRAYRFHHQAGDVLGCGRALMNVGHLLRGQLRWREAVLCFRRAKTLFRRSGAARLATLAQAFGREAARFSVLEDGDPLRN